MTNKAEDNGAPPSTEEELKYTKKVLSETIKELHDTKITLDEAAGALIVVSKMAINNTTRTLISDTLLQLAERLRGYAKTILNLDADIKELLKKD